MHTHVYVFLLMATLQPTLTLALCRIRLLLCHQCRANEAEMTSVNMRASSKAPSGFEPRSDAVDTTSTSHCADNSPLTHATQVMFRWAASPPDCTVIYVFAFSSLPTLTLRIIILSRVMNVLRGYIKWLNNRKQTFLLTPHAAGKKMRSLGPLHFGCIYYPPRNKVCSSYSAPSMHLSCLSTMLLSCKVTQQGFKLATAVITFWDPDHHALRINLGGVLNVNRITYPVIREIRSVIKQWS